MSQIIAPDTSHWAQWIDSALDTSSVKHQEALKFHDQLMSVGRIPLLTWHHLEELLAIEDGVWARRRVAFIQNLPFLAYIKFPNEEPFPGTIIDVLSAEVAAVLGGATNLLDVRNAARGLLIQTGSGAEVLGSEAVEWDVLREDVLKHRQHLKQVAAVRIMSLFDDRRTVAEIAKESLRTSEEQTARYFSLRQEVLDHILNRGDKDIADPRSMAEDFVNSAKELSIPDVTDVRSLLEFGLMVQGVDREEISDDAVLADLKVLAVFRSRLRIIANNIGEQFDTIKHVNMRILPSWQIQSLLGQFGQDRQRRPGSDIVDEALSALAPYVDELFVDRRTAEDFRRVILKKDAIVSSLGRIRKSPNFEGLAGQ
jgi:hypothetical protein